MSVANWKILYKYNNGQFYLPQKLYQPLVNPEKTVFCKNYNYNDQLYSLGNKYVGFHYSYAVDWFFKNEIYYLTKLKDFSFCPKVLDIDYKDKRIFIEWNDCYCDEFVYRYNNWPVDDWLGQLSDSVVGQVNYGIYKLTLDSHSHFIDKNGNLKAINYYGVVPITCPFLEKKIVQSYYQEQLNFKISKNDFVSGDYVNLEKKFKRSLKQNVKWGDYFLTTIYNKVFIDSTEETG